MTHVGRHTRKIPQNFYKYRGKHYIFWADVSKSTPKLIKIGSKKITPHWAPLHLNMAKIKNNFWSAPKAMNTKFKQFFRKGIKMASNISFTFLVWWRPTCKKPKTTKKIQGKDLTTCIKWANYNVITKNVRNPNPLTHVGRHIQSNRSYSAVIVKKTLSFGLRCKTGLKKW